MHTSVTVFPVNPTVIRCSCDAKVICDRPGKWAEHMSTGAHGEFHPWPVTEEVE